MYTEEKAKELKLKNKEICEIKRIEIKNIILKLTRESTKLYTKMLSDNKKIDNLTLNSKKRHELKCKKRNDDGAVMANRILNGEDLKQISKEFNLGLEATKRRLYTFCHIRWPSGYLKSYHIYDIEWLRSHKRLFIDPIELDIPELVLNNIHAFDRSHKDNI